MNLFVIRLKYICKNIFEKISSSVEPISSYFDMSGNFCSYLLECRLLETSVISCGSYICEAYKRLPVETKQLQRKIRRPQVLLSYPYIYIKVLAMGSLMESTLC